MTQLNLFISADLTDHAPLRAWLMRHWPVVAPWGCLGEHVLRRVVRIYPGEDYFALLLERGSHRWHITWAQGRAKSSSAGWTTVDGVRLDRGKEEVAR